MRRRSLLPSLSPDSSTILNSLAVLCLVSALSACGGDSPEPFTASEVSEVMTGPVRDTLREGMTMDALSCVGNGEQWECFTTVLSGDQRYTINVEIVCDDDSGECISKPYEYVPVP